MRSKINNLITRVGQKFGVDSHYFIKNTFWLLLGQGVISIAAFASTVVLANFVSKNSLGDYRLIVSVYNTLTFFALSGASTALIRSVVKGKEGSLALALSLKKRYGVLSFFVGTMIAVYFGFFKNNPMLGIGFFVMSACLPIIEAYSIYIPYLQAKHEFRYSSMHSGLVKLFAAITIIIVTYYHPTTIYLVAGFYISQALVTFFQYKLLTKQFPPKNNEVDTGMHQYAKHLTTAPFLGLLLSQADKIILYHFFGPIALAQYWIASSIPQEFGRVIGTLAQVVYPKLIEVSSLGHKKSFVKKLLVFTGVLFLISIFYSIIAYPFFSIFFPKYVDQAAMSIVLMFAAAVVPNWFVWQYYMAKGNIKIVYMANTLEPVIQIALYVLLVPFFGVWGLVLAVFFRTLCMNLVSFYVLRHV